MTSIVEGEHKITILPIKQLNIHSLPKYAKILIIGKRGTGKSYLVRDICKHMHPPTATIFSSHQNLHEFYNNKANTYYNMYNDIILNNIFVKQYELIKYNEKLKDEYAEDVSKLIVIDNMFNNSHWCDQDTCLYELLYSGKSYHLSTIITTPYSLNLPPSVREQFDLIFLFYEDYNANIKRLYEHYGEMFSDYETFRDIFNELTKNHCCMVIRQHIKSQDIIDSVFWYKSV
jgi:Cdc6-like AAA superfamily ATPase